LTVNYFQNDGHDVISRSKVLPPGEWTQRLPSVYAASTVSS